MKTHLLAIVCLTAVSALALAAPEKEGKRPGVTDYPFWSTPKRPDSPQFIPGLNAILQLTPEQEEKIAAARSEAANDEEVKAARTMGKGNPSATPEQREKARAVVEAASTKLRERVKAVLTPEQLALIGKVNGAYQASHEEIGTIYEEKYASVKADEAARRRLQDEKNQDVEDNFLHKLDGLLSPEQKDAMTRAAEDEQRRNTATKKPSK